MLIRIFFTDLPVRLNSGPDNLEAFFIEIALESPPLGCTQGAGWVGVFACTLNDPVGVIQLAGVGSGAGLLSIANITTNISAPLNARVETIGAGHHVTMETKAGLFGSILPLPIIPHLPLVDLSTAQRSTSNQTLFNCLVLTHQQRLISQTMFYSTDSEVSLMIRLIDRADSPDNTQSKVYFLIDPDPGISGAVWKDGQTLATKQLWIPAPFYEDGWYGVQFRGSVPYLNISISIAIETFDALGETSPTRRIVYGIIPSFSTLLPQSNTTYATIQLGSPAPLCPWEARFPAVIATSSMIRLVGQLTQSQLATITTTIACALNVPVRRVTLAFSPPQVTITVQVESFLRAYDVNLMILSPTQLSQWFGNNLTLLSIERRALLYQFNQEDLPTPCPPNQYFTPTGAFRPIPKHSKATPDCYGYACIEGFVLLPDVNQCVPAYVSDSVYWTVVGLITTLILAVLIISIITKLVLAHNKTIQSKQAVVEENPPDATLPIAVTAQGELVFEMSDESSSGDDTDQSDPAY